MKIEEYKQKLTDLQKNWESDKIKLAKEYIDSNRIFAVGDIITDGYTIIKIQKLGYYISFSDPESIYHGVQLKKDLTEAKKQKDTTIYGNRPITKLN